MFVSSDGNKKALVSVCRLIRILIAWLLNNNVVRCLEAHFNFHSIFKFGNLSPNL